MPIQQYYEKVVARSPMEGRKDSINDRHRENTVMKKEEKINIKQKPSEEKKVC